MDNVMLQTAWGWQIALYLFLGGLAAGTLFVSALLDIRRKDAFKRTSRFGAWAAAIFLIVGVLLLLTELTMPLRGLLMWQSFSNLGSWMALGAWFLFVGIVLTVLYAASLTDKLVDKLAWLAKLRKPLSYALLVVSVLIALYTGILLAVLASHPLWNTPLLPVLFTVSALDTGVALVVIYLALKEEGEEVEEVRAKLEKATLVLVAVEAVVLVALLLTVSGATEIGALSVALLVNGTLAVEFWLLFVVLGLVCPAIVAFLALKNKLDGERGKRISLAGSALCLVGGCALRFLVLLAGLPIYL